ncbi:MAG: glycosyltransferase family 4 protein [Clostridiales bacterium]|jgi:glycosyltransferase involved in cell wall biosynthesis|nr:glycosyltransferase family 4 protein [Clostridiales bacterium]
MRILIDLTSLIYHITGIERFAICVSQKLLCIDKKNEYVLLFNKEIHKLLLPLVDNKRIFAYVFNCKSKLFLFQVALPILLYLIKGDRYLFFAFPCPMLFKSKGVFSTIHDMGPWEAPYAFSYLQKLYLKISTRFAVYNSQGIITVSQFSKNRISEILRVKTDKINVVYSGVNDRLTENWDLWEKVKSNYVLPEKYILALSTFEPKKNLLLLLSAFLNVEEYVDYDIVLVGRNGWKTKEIFKSIKNEKRVHVTGFVEDSSLPEIYRHALCFIFPSKYEGFGLPPVEALSFGTPVIASDAASIPEVLGQQATYFQNDSIDELSKLLLDLEKLVPHMATCLSPKQRELYDFNTVAKAILDIISRDFSDK